MDGSWALRLIHCLALGKADWAWGRLQPHLLGRCHLVPSAPSTTTGYRRQHRAQGKEGRGVTRRREEAVKGEPGYGKGERNLGRWGIRMKARMAGSGGLSSCFP